MFFKRLSRSRSNSRSYADEQPTTDGKAGSYDEHMDYSTRPDSSQQSNSGFNNNNHTQKQNGQLYSPHDSAHQEYHSAPLSRSSQQNMPNTYTQPSSRAGSVGGDFGKPGEGPTDLLTRAFNEAIRPYTSKIEEMEVELAEMRAYTEQLESQRKEVHAWIDKRGLRPGIYII